MLLSNFPMQTSDRFRICLPPKVGAQTSFHECYIVLWLLLCFTIYYVSEMFRPVTCFRKLSVKCRTLYHKKPVMSSTLPSYVQNLIWLNLSGTHFPVFVHDRCGWTQGLRSFSPTPSHWGRWLPWGATTSSITTLSGECTVSWMRKCISQTVIIIIIITMIIMNTTTTNNSGSYTVQNVLLKWNEMWSYTIHAYS